MGPVYGFATLTGRVNIDHGRCLACADKPCVAACPAKLMALQDGKPVLVADADLVAKGKCTECLACELACDLKGRGALVLDLPLPRTQDAGRHVRACEGGTVECPFWSIRTHG